MKRTGKICTALLCLIFVLALSVSAAAETGESGFFGFLSAFFGFSSSGDAVPENAGTGSEPVPVWKFFHALTPEGLDTAVFTCSLSDCEAGPVPQELSEEDEKFVRDLAINGVVTDLASEISVTGGTWIYTFTSPEGKHLLSVELYKGMLVGPYGMYNYSR